METFTRSNDSLTPKGSTLTCISCRLLFDTAKEQREHYKSDLHRFNLKRKVAKLPPVTNEAFEQKVKSISDHLCNIEALMTEKKNSSAATSAGLNCTICNKQYSSANSFGQHLKSKKHLEKAAAGDQESPQDDISLNAEQTKDKLEGTERQDIEDLLHRKEKITNDLSNDQNQTVNSEQEPIEPTESTEATEMELIEERIKNARRLPL